MLCTYFFFFKQKTAYEMRISDWSSDVCSSDLAAARVHHRRDAVHRSLERPARQRVDLQLHRLPGLERGDLALGHVQGQLQARVVDDAEDRRVDLHEVAGLDRTRCNYAGIGATTLRSEEHTSALQSLMRTSY